MRFLLPMLFLIPLCAQPPQVAPPAGGGGRQRQPPKNLKILKPEEVGPAMRSFTVALGVRCDYCHVSGDMSSDEKPKKLVARNMIEMSHQINGHFPDGKMHVSCYTCHRGVEEPATAPPAAPAAQ